MRRSHDHLIPPGVARCSRCNHAIKPHHVCANCGYYGDNQVVDVEAGRG
jgi:large subunit ribosomal protein L32